MQRIAAVSIVPQSYGRNNIQRGRMNDYEKLESRSVDSEENCDGQTCHHDVDSEGTVRLECGCRIPVIAFVTSKCTRNHDDILNSDRGPVGKAIVNDDEVRPTCLRDTGASLDLVRESRVKSDQLTSKTITCMLADGTCKKCPVARVNVESEWCTGSTEAACVKDLIYALIIGNKRLGNPEIQHKKTVDSSESAEVVMEEVDDVNEEVSDDKVENDGEQQMNAGDSKSLSGREVIEEQASVETRAMKLKAKEAQEALKVPELQAIKVTPEEFRDMQKADDDFQKYWELSKQEQQETEGRAIFVERNGLLYRKYRPNSDRADTDDVMQLMVPEKLRGQVIEYAHSSLLGSHVGINKTVARILSEFWWSGMNEQVKRYCWSCDVCQKCTKKTSVAKAPMQSLPIVGRPFDFVYVDIVGPLMETGTRDLC